MPDGDKITPCLWFDGNAEEAVAFYLSIFGDGRIRDVMRCGDTGPGGPGSVMTITFTLHGRDFLALNGGPHFKFSEAISMFVVCETQAEVDTLWDKLVDGGEPQQCGWLKDRFGLSWQIVPIGLQRLLQDPDAARAGRVMQALMSMVKIDLDALQQVYGQ